MLLALIRFDVYCSHGEVAREKTVRFGIEGHVGTRCEASEGCVEAIVSDLPLIPHPDRVKVRAVCVYQPWCCVCVVAATDDASADEGLA